jgi:hypothetical protein
MELNKYGLLLARAVFRVLPWDQNPGAPTSLSFGTLFQDLLKAIVGTERFYGATAYRGDVSIRCSLHNVRGKAMLFLPYDVVFGNAIDDFRCYTDIVCSESTAPAMLLGAQRIDVLTKMLSELTWPFWQSLAEYPAALLRNHVEQLVRGMGRL